MAEEKWKTSVTKVEPNKLLLRGYRIDDLMGSLSFSQAIFLAIKGDLPSENEGRMMDAILVSSIDHGVTPPSCIAARTIASVGSPLNAAVAAGVLAISRFHGGAIEDSMRLFQAALQRTKEKNEGEVEAADAIVREYKASKRRLPGYGHRLHTKDPRSVRLFEIARNLGIAAGYVGVAGTIETAIERGSGKRLPLNVDGAIAAVLCEMGFPTELANAFFIMARVPGLVAHVYEEQTRMKPMRRIDPGSSEYDGPPERRPGK
jgi:citrate synthase